MLFESKKVTVEGELIGGDVGYRKGYPKKPGTSAMGFSKRRCCAKCARLLPLHIIPWS